MKCAVFNCKSNNNKDKRIRFFSFPKDKKIRKAWIFFCKRKDEFNANTSRICSLHFASEDMERSLQHEMGFATIHQCKLKTGTIPTIHTESNAPAPSTSSRTNRMKARAKKEMLTYLLEQDPEPQPDTIEMEDAEIPPINTPEEDVLNVSDENVSIYSLKERIQYLENQVGSLTRDRFTLQLQLKLKEEAFQKKMSSMEKLLKASELQRVTMEESLKTVFTKGQVNKLKMGLKKTCWFEEDIINSIMLYSTSAKAYKLLRRKNFPLPGVRTLQNWAQKICTI